MDSPTSVQSSESTDACLPYLLFGKSIAVIGGGFYGCATALKLADQGFKVTLFEQHSNLFRGSSGTYGVRLHTGPHYPRSPSTRIACRSVLNRFKKEFPGLVSDAGISLYGLGIKDAEGLPARVTVEEFDKVCQECENYDVANPEEYNVQGVSGLWKVYEPVLYQERAKALFTKLLQFHPNVQLVFNHHVQNLQNCVGMDRVSVDGKIFDWAVNCTYFTSFSDKMVAGAHVKFQPCLTLIYDDLKSKRGDQTSTLTIMDGWFPCFMPLVSDDTSQVHNRYMLYHAKYTILGSYDSYKDCQDHITRVTEEWVQSEARPRMEKHFETFLTDFRSRYKYCGYRLDSASKLRTSTEFRSAIVYRTGRIIHEFSGKLTENVAAVDEVLQIINSDLPNHSSSLSQKTMQELASANQNTYGACDMGVDKW